jgi:hypothetical protein
LSLEVRSKNMAFTPSALINPKSTWQRMWYGLKAEVIILKYQPSHRYLDRRQQCRTFKSVVSRPYDWMLLVLAMRARGASLTKTDSKTDEW